MKRTILTFLVVSIAPITACVERAFAEGKDVSGFVAKLGDSSNETRGTAAASIRRVLITDPSAKSNDHGRDYWQRHAAKVELGTKHAEVVKLLPCYDQSGAGPGTGDSHVRQWRLDHYWVIMVQYRNPDTVIDRLVLRSEAMRVWVDPPENYTGTWVTWFVNGEKSHRIEYDGGKYHGSFTSYYENGRKQFEQHYVKGVCSGTDTGWYADGAKSYEGRYENGQQEGIWTHWHKNGQKHLEIHYKNGKKDGPEQSWDEEGKLQNTNQHPVDSPAPS